MLTTQKRKRRVASYIGADVTEPSGTPRNTAKPSISGVARVGVVLTGNVGMWTASPTFVRAWLANNVAISGATAATYTPVTGDIGKVITFRVTATANTNSTVAASGPTAAVIAA